MIHLALWWLFVNFRVEKDIHIWSKEGSWWNVCSKTWQQPSRRSKGDWKSRVGSLVLLCCEFENGQQYLVISSPTGQFLGRTRLKAGRVNAVMHTCVIVVVVIGRTPRSFDPRPPYPAYPWPQTLTPPGPRCLYAHQQYILVSQLVSPGQKDQLSWLNNERFFRRKWALPWKQSWSG